ncbi:PG0870-related protein [Bacteroides fragilis]|uniref:PG0870-related protein n=1 Tax=Bacteroides fragilis TaxID=817 RepID=UPI0021769DE9|nr:PG0870-related protein [Bacteroides fragilis]
MEKYKNRSSRHMCSQCGRARCFTYYVNENGQPFDKSVGRCDHESGCGYHYPTKEYFKDNPDKNMKLC